MDSDLLNKPIASASAVVVLLELDEFELAKGLENILEILLGDTEMDVANVETVERNGIGVGARAVCSAYLAILLSLGKLDDDRNT